MTRQDDYVAALSRQGYVDREYVAELERKADDRQTAYLQAYNEEAALFLEYVYAPTNPLDGTRLWDNS